MAKKKCRGPEQSSEELAVKALKVQNENPLLSEGALCGELGYEKHFLVRRSRKDPLLRALRARLSAIRQAAWEKRGEECISAGKDANATVYIWMTRNILGWRNEPREPLKKDSNAPAPTSEAVKQLIRQFEALLDKGSETP